jgi:hypothetical protein
MMLLLRKEMSKTTKSVSKCQVTDPSSELHVKKERCSLARTVQRTALCLGREYTYVRFLYPITQMDANIIPPWGSATDFEAGSITFSTILSFAIEFQQ